jgi:signal transduction histidine kinase
MFLAAFLVALASAGPLSYLLMVSLLELDDAVFDLNRKEAQVDYLVNIVLEKDESEKDKLLQDSKSFAQSVAHDLKTPLTTVLGFAAMLSDKQAQIPAEQQKSALQAIVRTSLKMNNIIQELLLLAAVRQENVKTGPVHMAGVVNAARQRLWGVIADANIDLVIPEADCWPAVVGYAPWIEEAWINYISNAIKYGGRPARVELGAEADYKVLPNGRKLARFWVRDNGRGIAFEDQSQLFNQFTRLDQVRAEGHGLGLSIVARIIEKLGGEAGVESFPGQGSTFFFTLPMVYVEPPTRVRQQTNWFRE